ncbi:MFS transporter [Acidilobus saccharovorans]|uniref:MFS transporter n=1 Tax=Acidilobus saccharovorans TaxID=242703 RepID=UPI003B82C81F
MAGLEYKWKALSVTSVGSLMSAIDSTVVLLALVPIAEDLHADYVTIVWIVVAYLLANTSLVLTFGRVGDTYGRKKIYNAGFVVFTIGSLLSALSQSGLELVAFRALQGIGSAMMLSNSLAIISEAFPVNERGRALGINSIVWSSGTVLGIILGGLIITYTTWRWIFLINVPIGIFGTAWAYATLRETKFRRVGENFDVPAAVLFTLGILALQLGFTLGLLRGWSDVYTLLSFAAAPPLLAAFAFWELYKVRDPIVDLRMFKYNRMFTASIFTATVQSLAMFAVNFLLLFYLEGIFGLPVLTASYLIIPMAAVNMIAGPIGGRLTDKYGPRPIATAGLVIQGAALFLLAMMNARTPLWWVAMVEGIYGLGGGLFWPSNTTAVISSAPRERYGVASGTLTTFRNTGMILSFAVSLTSVTAALPAYYVYQLFVGTLSGHLPSSLMVSYLNAQAFAYHVSLGLLAIAAVLSALRPSGTLARHSGMKEVAAHPMVRTSDDNGRS